MKLHSIPVKCLEILRINIPSRRREVRSPCCLLWQRRDHSPHSLERIYRSQQTRWLPRTANRSAGIESVHELGWIFFNFTCYRGWGRKVRNKHKVTLLRLAQRCFSRLLDYLLFPVIYLALSLLRTSNSVLNVPIFRKATLGCCY